MKTYRVWFKNESAVLVNESSHELACVKATYQARANEIKNGTERHSKDWVNYTLVTKTTCLSSDTTDEVYWTPKQVRDLIRSRLDEQEKYEAQLIDG